jgi:hypothetical protein
MPTAFQSGLGLPTDQANQILHDHNQSPYTLNYFTYINNFGWTIALGFAKLSICALYWRLFRHSSIRNGIRIVAGITAVWLVAAVRAKNQVLKTSTDVGRPLPWPSNAIHIRVRGIRPYEALVSILWPRGPGRLPAISPSTSSSCPFP